MPAANPARPEAYTVEQWDAACERAKRKYSDETWENPPYAGQADPDGWRFSQCYMKALQMFPEVVHLNPSVGPRDIPKDTVDTVYQMEITEGMQMVDFHGEYGFGRYYPLEVYVALKDPKLNPMTRQPIDENDVIQYTAHIVPKAGGRRTRTKRTRTKRTKRTKHTKHTRKHRHRHSLKN
jgi:hypothetical protein